MSALPLIPWIGGKRRLADQVMAAFLVMLSCWGMLAVVLLAIEGVAKKLT